MKTCRYAFALLLALTATLSAEPPIARVHDCDVIDDRVMRERFGVELAKLVEEGEATDGEELQEQLERGFHELKLPKPSRRSMRQASIYEHVKRSVVLVGSIHKCGNCDKWHANFASGFVVRPDGIIATNYHVLDKKEDKTMGVMTFDGDVYLVREVLAANKTDDTALIQVEAEGLEPLPLRADVAVGSPVSVLSHPNKRLYMFTRGVVSRYFSQRRPGDRRHRRRRRHGRQHQLHLLQGRRRPTEKPPDGGQGLRPRPEYSRSLPPGLIIPKNSHSLHPVFKGAA